MGAVGFHAQPYKRKRGGWQRDFEFVPAAVVGFRNCRPKLELLSFDKRRAAYRSMLDAQWVQDLADELDQVAESARPCSY